MSTHLLKTTNPQAAAEASAQPAPSGAPQIAEIPGWGTNAVPPVSADPVHVDDEEIPPQVEETTPDFANDYIEIDLDQPKPGPKLPPLPGLGAMVIYHSRESRNRRFEFPSVVINRDVEKHTLDMIVMIDINDIWLRERVEEKTGDEPGWSLSDGTLELRTLEKRVETVFASLIGNNFVAEDDPSLYDRISDLYKRVEALESAGREKLTAEQAEQRLAPLAAGDTAGSGSPVQPAGRKRRT